MSTRTADLRGALLADLPHGRIETRDHRRLIALPIEWFDTVAARTPADALAPLGAALGVALEADARAVLGDERDPSPEDVAYALSAALAARGLGLVRLEQWGDALAVVWRNPPSASEAFREMAASAIAALVGKLAGLEVSGAPVGFEGGELRVLLASAPVCQMARESARRGESLSQIVMRFERRAEET